METKQYPDMECDVVIAGCGVAGLYAALNLPTSTRVIMLSKGAVDECDSMLAQGGICVLPEGSDYDAFFEDTMHAGHYENRRESVDIMIRSSRSVINDLLAMGVDFERKADGSLDFTREGAHSRPRIAFHADITGKEITTKLLQAVRKLDNVQILEHVAMTDILTGERDGATVCAGVVAVSVDEDNSVRPADELANAAEGVHAGEPFKIHARHTLWATGGIGGVYDHSTNYPQLTGDACYIAQEHGIKMEHLDYVQIHPTGLFSPQPGRTFLISESCRGEGAILLNAAGERFTDELQPRDVVAAAIREQMKQDGTITFTVNVKNTGKRAGAETVQLYIHDVKSSVDRPQKELKGFQKVYLQPGESKDISITISKEALSFYDEASSSWKAEAGKFEALVGNAADNLKLKKAFELF